MRIFISSAYRGLEELRQGLIARLETAGQTAARMEIFGSRPETPLDTCLSELRSSDLVVLVGGARYGALIPGEGISYTHREFREAQTFGIPVLAFFLKDDPASDRATADQLKAFKEEIGKYVTYQETTKNDLVASVLASLLHHIQTHGDGAPYRVFQTPDVFFRPLLLSNAAFRLSDPLVGRESELSTLQGFVESPGPGVAQIVAPGGIGKTKLLLELANRLKDSGNSLQFRFIPQGVPWSPETLKELPSGHFCVVIDDAHRRDDLGVLLPACLQFRPDVKFILTMRPELKATVRHALRSLVDDPEKNTIELSALSRVQSVELSKATLAPPFGHLAERLAQLADGNPLIITVGARAISQKQIPPDLLHQNSEAFRRAALDRLLDNIPSTSLSAAQFDRLISLVAAFSPISADSEEFWAAAAKFVNSPTSALRQAGEALERAGLFVRRGRLLRIMPDVLSDHILFKNAVTRDGKPTGLLDELAEQFTTFPLDNLLANAAELEWRSQALDTPIRVSDGIWSRVRSILQAASHWQRSHLVPDLLRRPAIFAPDRTLQLVEWLIGERTAPVDERTHAWGLSDSHESVLRVLPELLGLMAQHLQVTRRCVRHLCDLALNDLRPTNPNPHHPVRVLIDLAEYKINLRTDLQLEVLHELASFYRNPDRRDACPWIASAVAPILHRQGESRKWSIHGVTLGSFALFPFINNITVARAKAMDLLVEMAVGNNAVEAAEAVGALSRLLAPPESLFGRVVGPDEMSAWEPEVRDAVARLKVVAQKTPYQAIRLLIHELPEKQSHRGWPALGESVNELSLSTQTDEQKLLHVLMGPHRRHNPNWQEAEREFNDQVVASAEWVLRAYPAASEILECLEGTGKQVAALSAGKQLLPPDGMRFVFRQVFVASPKMAFDIGMLVARENRVFSRAAISEGLVVLREQGRSEECHELAATAAKSQDENIRFEVAANLRWLLHIGSVSRDDLRFVALFTNDRNNRIRAYALNGLRSFDKEFTREALEILVGTDVGSDEHDINEAVGIVGQYGIGIDKLMDGDVDALLRTIERATSIDQAYSITEFLRASIKRRPREVVEMLLRRIDAAETAAKSDAGNRYQPLPYTPEHWKLLDEDAQLMLQLAPLVLTAATEDGWKRGFWLPRLFFMVVPKFEVVRELLTEWVMTGELSRVRAVSRVLKDYGHELIFVEDSFVGALLGASWDLGTDCYKRVSEELFGIAVGGTYSSAPGEPAPRRVQDRNRAVELAAKHGANRPVFEFYDALVKFNKAEIRRQAEDWETELGIEGGGE